MMESSTAVFTKVCVFFIKAHPNILHNKYLETDKSYLGIAVNEVVHVLVG